MSERAPCDFLLHLFMITDTFIINIAPQWPAIYAKLNQPINPRLPGLILFYSHLSRSINSPWYQGKLVFRSHHERPHGPRVGFLYHKCNSSLRSLIDTKYLFERDKVHECVRDYMYTTDNHFHWNWNLVIILKFSSLAALEVVKMTNSGAASD